MMNSAGLILGLAAFFSIGVFHPIVIKAEYYFGKECWWVFALAGAVCNVVALFMNNVIASAVVGVFGFSAFWSILELYKQEKRVQKGWFPSNPNRLKKKRM